MTATDVPIRTRERALARLFGDARQDAMCIAVPQILAGEGAVIARNLRRHGKQNALVLARRSDPRELVHLLVGGVRGAVAIEPGDQPAPQPAASLQQFAAPQPGPTPTSPLTARELSVLALVADGQSNRDVGESLGLSALTVKSHLARIARKLGSGDRAALVAIALRQGLM